jgi:DNA polymerase III subunit delta
MMNLSKESSSEMWCSLEYRASYLEFTLCYNYLKIKNRSITLLHVLFGEDDFSLRQALEDIKKSIGDATALMSNTNVFEGKIVSPEQLRAACESIPFLSEKRLVIAEGLLDKFESKKETGRKKPAKKPDKVEAYAAFASAMVNLPPFTELVVTGGKLSDRNPLLQELVKITKVKTFPLLKGKDIIAWIEKRVNSEAKGKKISPKASALMARLVGSDFWTMANEVDKLILFTGGRDIGEDDVKAVVSSAQEANIFNMVDSIIEQRIGAAQELLQQLFRQGMAPVQILVMISRQVRIIYLVREMRAAGKPRAEMMGKLGLTSDFVLRKAWEQAERYSPARIREVYHLLLEADISIKTGKVEGELALDILIAEMGRSGAVPAN